MATPGFIAARIENEGCRKVELYDPAASPRDLSRNPRAEREAASRCGRAIDHWLKPLETLPAPQDGPEVDEEMRQFLQSLGWIH